jgi:hypothetical protein
MRSKIFTAVLEETSEETKNKVKEYADKLVSKSKIPMEKQLTPIQQAIEKLEKSKMYKHNQYQLAIGSTIVYLESLLPIEQKAFIDFHVEVMNLGLIVEDDVKWKDKYKPKIEEIANSYFETTYKTEKP